MTDAANLNASVSHISMMHRPYGPRVHMDEAAASAPASMPDTFSSVRAAANFLTEERNRKDNPSAAGGDADAGDDDTSDDDADHGAADEHELSVEDNAALGEDQDPGEDQGADPEDKLPPIARPKSWGKEDQAEWDDLSRSQQEKIAAREETREKAIRKAQNDAAESSRGSTAKEQAADKAKSEYEQKARDALGILEREQQRDYADIKTVADVTNLAATDPLRYLKWQAHQTELAAMKATVDRADQDKAAKTAKDWQDFRSKETAAALEHIPELGDKVKGPKLMQKAVDLLQEIGFQPGELNKFDKGEKLSLFDHRIQRVLVDAIRYRDIQAARKAAVTKPVPPVQRPGARQPAVNVNSDRVKTLNARLSQTGSLKDAAALLTAERAAKSRRR